MRHIGAGVPVLWFATVAGCGDVTGPAEPGQSDPQPTATFQLGLTEVVSGLTSPVYLTAPLGDERLFIVEQPGRIRVHRAGQAVPGVFLDITSSVLSGGERGLLSMAFHPDYASNGYLYLSYTDRNGDTRVDRYTVSADPDVADPQSVSTILMVGQPFSNHNGGLIGFGPDGMLYVGLGDGGSGGDPQAHGQNLGTLLGAMLRIDVDGGFPYAIPADNPFVNDSTARGEIWAYGLRNPWRWAFDQMTGLLYIADVGQDQWEEVNVVPAGQGGLNFGWNVAEGDHCFINSGCDRSGFVTPVLEYDHGEGCSVTGGFVYRGPAIPEIDGHYFYADYCSGWVRSFRFADGSATERRQWDLPNVGSIFSFGVGGRGEMYVLASSGRVFRLAAIR